MANSHLNIRAQYDDFLRGQRFNVISRIETSVDDFVQRSRNLQSGTNKGSNNGIEAVGWGCPRVRIALSELRSENPRLEQRLRADPLRHLRALEDACHEIAKETRQGYDKNDVKIKVAVSGPIAASASSPRDLTSSSLRQLICVEGVATKVSSIKPKVVKSVHYCPSTSQHEEREYIDATDPQLGLPALDSNGQELADSIINVTSSIYPTKDKEGNLLETEYGLSRYKDHQTVTLQEMPERAPMGQLPRSVELILDHDLVDKIKPGDRIQVVGVYRAMASSIFGQSSTSGLFKTVVLVNNILVLGRDSSRLEFSPEDIREIKTLGKCDNILNILGRSIAPSIHGHDIIKKALALQLLSGCEKNLANGTHLRGDINILMVGDPSTAKSQLLRAVMTIAPLAVSTTGKGSSGVGLTAAVTSDPDTRERRLEAGAMVLADRGIVCVDEFDKMSESDRVAIHEAMEQQTVTIAKAGIHASLNARCSVLAAANPVYGQYDRRRRMQENIGLPDSLLSRFDLLFVVLDQLDPESDRKIASHVISGHRYRTRNGQSEHDSDYDDQDDSEDEGATMGNSKTHSIWQMSQKGRKTTEFTHLETEENDDPHSDDVLQHDFLRKYLRFAKQRYKPVLTEEARECIANRYGEMRSRQDERTLPVTARSLETIIRLATAHAKARLSTIVEADPDCSAALDILSFALYHDSKNTNETKSLQDIGTERRPVTPDPVVRDPSPNNDADNGNAKKRMRVDNDSAKSSVVSSAQIWEKLNRTGQGEISIEELCEDDADRSSILETLEIMEKGGRVMTSDGIVYQID
mmetsp:Transcript_7876/g.7468  ORF Transcript_7876/g.7468 Transcript_7876/m.7468 type:complete len:808 (-) Transcript_7876:256-2679(-)|eukprot:CAMPEP_0197834930 /NCGR_PEP_ID=MMETSP1437-20131217/24150_1 /TAXON_ID=49252 ORGANISM="Eucampia antarctica, Strain CCMP1452" /NCGR_SAMPLE_ID=MMETSP1437 /ASSEMBLY_ACC=CAM_ASM_001096 /LENGTH=807 /DNA_ID=CAMNT_0043439985 /DNA_START=27 /DNA_END=2450 /DNA_ORIENTATION=+